MQDNAPDDVPAALRWYAWSLSLGGPHSGPWGTSDREATIRAAFAAGTYGYRKLVQRFGLRLATVGRLSGDPLSATLACVSGLD